MQVLRGIENEDFVPCGGDFYARGHIRRICKFLGLDPAPLLEEYDREHASADQPAFVPLPRHPSAMSKAARAAAAQGGRAHAGVTDQEASPDVPRRIGDEDVDPLQRAENWGHFERNQKLARPPQRNRPMGAAMVPEPRQNGRHGGAGDGERDGGSATRAGATATRAVITRTSARGAESVRRHWPWAVVGVILVTAVFVGVRTWQGWDEGNPVRTAFESARSNGSETVDSAVLPNEPAEEPVERVQAAEVEEAPAEFTVALTGSGRSWVKITGPAGEDLFTGFLVAGDEQDYVTDEPLTLWLGNAGAVAVAVDGQDHGPSGGIGEVREITVGADGFDD